MQKETTIKIGIFSIVKEIIHHFNELCILPWHFIILKYFASLNMFTELKKRAKNQTKSLQNIWFISEFQLNFSTFSALTMRIVKQCQWIIFMLMENEAEMVNRVKIMKRTKCCAEILNDFSTFETNSAIIFFFFLFRFFSSFFFFVIKKCPHFECTKWKRLEFEIIIFSFWIQSEKEEQNNNGAMIAAVTFSAFFFLSTFQSYTISNWSYRNGHITIFIRNEIVFINECELN